MHSKGPWLLFVLLHDNDSPERFLKIGFRHPTASEIDGHLVRFRHCTSCSSTLIPLNLKGYQKLDCSHFERGTRAGKWTSSSSAASELPTTTPTQAVPTAPATPAPASELPTTTTTQAVLTAPSEPASELPTATLTQAVLTAPAPASELPMTLTPVVLTAPAAPASELPAPPSEVLPQPHLTLSPASLRAATSAFSTPMPELSLSSSSSATAAQQQQQPSAALTSYLTLMAIYSAYGHYNPFSWGVPAPEPAPAPMEVVAVERPLFPGQAILAHAQRQLLLDATEMQHPGRGQPCRFFVSVTRVGQLSPVLETSFMIDRKRNMRYALEVGEKARGVTHEQQSTWFFGPTPSGLTCAFTLSGGLGHRRIPSGGTVAQIAYPYVSPYVFAAHLTAPLERQQEFAGAVFAVRLSLHFLPSYATTFVNRVTDSASALDLVFDEPEDVPLPSAVAAGLAPMPSPPPRAQKKKPEPAEFSALHPEREVMAYADLSSRQIVASVKHRVSLHDAKSKGGRIKSFQLLVTVTKEHKTVMEHSFLFGYRCRQRMLDCIRDPQHGESHQYRSFWHINAQDDSGLCCTFTLDGGSGGHRRIYRPGCAVLKGASQPAADDMIASIGTDTGVPYNFLAQISLPATAAAADTAQYTVSMSLIFSTVDEGNLTLIKKESSEITAVYGTTAHVMRLTGKGKRAREEKQEAAPARPETPPPALISPKKAKTAKQMTPSSASKFQALAAAAMAAAEKKNLQQQSLPLPSPGLSIPERVAAAIASVSTETHNQPEMAPYEPSEEFAHLESLLAAIDAQK